MNTPSSDCKKIPLILLTGLSGAGLSSALKNLEDLGFEAFDNFPLRLLDPLLGTAGHALNNPIAIGVDARTRDFSPASMKLVLESLKARDNLDVSLVFLTADEAVLLKRFTETRRRHPLADDRPIADGIKVEQRWLYDLREMSDHVIDTTELSIHDLKRILHGHFLKPDTKLLTVSIISFSFKRGIPREADLVFDVRFLKNPHWDENLRLKNGTNTDVQEYIATDTSFAPFTNSLKALLQPLLPRYREEGKAYLTIAFGCTGGKHRSVFVAHDIGSWLKNQNTPVTIIHRDMKD